MPLESDEGTLAVALKEEEPLLNVFSQADQSGEEVCKPQYECRLLEGNIEISQKA